MSKTKAELRAELVRERIEADELAKDYVGVINDLDDADEEIKMLRQALNEAHGRFVIASESVNRFREANVELLDLRAKHRAEIRILEATVVDLANRLRVESGRA